MYRKSKQFIAFFVLIMTSLSCGLIGSPTQTIPVTPVVHPTQIISGEQLLNWRAIDGQWALEQDALVSTVPGDRGWSEGRCVASVGSSWQDYSFSGTIKFHPSQYHEIGILFRVQDVKPEFPGQENQGEYYQISLYVESQDIIFYRIKNGDALVLKSLPYNFVPDRWYTFRVELSGTTMSFFLDNQLVFEYDGLAEYPSGGVGVKTYGNTVGYFRELRLHLKK
jgi:hypothetical protein